VGLEKRRRNNLDLWKRILGIPIGTRVRLLRSKFPIAERGEEGRVISIREIKTVGKFYCVELDDGRHLFEEESFLEIVEKEYMEKNLELSSL